jgi:protein SCO1
MASGQALGNATAAGPSAHTAAPDLSNVGIDQRLNAQVPLDLPFNDEKGSAVTLQKYFNQGKPVILSLVYFNCPMLCPEVLSGMTHTLRLVKFDMGKDYEVLTVSFDPKDTPKSAADEKEEQLRALGKPGAAQGWHFLTGSEDSIQKLTRAVGFRYKWDASSHQFNHATAIMILTPEGKVSKYFYGVEYKPADMRFGLIQASNHRIGSVVDEVLLFCCQYNPTTGKYDLLVSRLLSVAGAITVLVLGSFLFVMFRIGKPGSNKKRSQESRAAGSSS